MDAFAIVGEGTAMARKGNGGNGSFAERLVSLIGGAEVLRNVVSSKVRETVVLIEGHGETRH